MRIPLCFDGGEKNLIIFVSVYGLRPLFYCVTLFYERFLTSVVTICRRLELQWWKGNKKRHVSDSWRFRGMQAAKIKKATSFVCIVTLAFSLRDFLTYVMSSRQGTTRTGTPAKSPGTI
jgi:hypothetical protein